VLRLVIRTCQCPSWRTHYSRPMMPLSPLVPSIRTFCILIGLYYPWNCLPMCLLSSGYTMFVHTQKQLPDTKSLAPNIEPWTFRSVHQTFNSAETNIFTCYPPHAWPSLCTICYFALVCVLLSLLAIQSPLPCFLCSAELGRPAAHPPSITLKQQEHRGLQGSQWWSTCLQCLRLLVKAGIGGSHRGGGERLARTDSCPRL
jgi:hypothetical protein